MDQITQGLLGAATAQLGFRQRLGRGASWAAGIAAIVADLDLIVPPLARLLGLNADQFSQMRSHRGISHSLLAAPVIALLVALPWWLRRRKRAAAEAPRPPIVDRAAHPEVAAIPPEPPPPLPSFLPFFACTLIAAATHPLLDWCTSYGTQLFAPITDRRFALDAVPIIDLFYTPILLVTLVACWLVRKLKGGRAPRASLAIGWAGILLSTGYLAAGYCLRGVAAEKALDLARIDARTARSKTFKANAYPYLGTILLWRATVETDGHWLAARIRPLNAFDPASVRWQLAPKDNRAAVRRARRLPQVKEFEWFAMGQIRGEYRREEKQHVVLLHDMRYGQPPESVESLWPVRVTYDRAWRLVSVERTRPGRGGSFGQMVGRAWREILTP